MTEEELAKLKEDIQTAEKHHAGQFPESPVLINFRLQLALVEEVRELRQSLQDGEIKVVW